MRPAMLAILAVQVVTYVILGGLFLRLDNWRLGATQLLLAVVQGVIYSG